MRTLTLSILLIAFAPVLFAQEETLLTSDSETGGFGGPVAKLTRIHGQDALILGGRGGWIIDHVFVIGGGAYGIATEVNAPTSVFPEQGRLDIQFNCFGLELEYIFRPNSLIHASLYALVGGGAVRFVREHSRDTQVDETDLAFVFEPAANVELNLTTWCRVMAGASYRITTGVTQVGLRNGDFTGPSASLTIKFGSF